MQWLQSVLDASLNAALVALLVLSYAIPPVLTVLLAWKRRAWRPNVAVWRWRIWQIGLALAAFAAVAVPVFLLGLQCLSSAAKQRWFIDAGMRGMLYALSISPVAVLLLGFGRGRQRWIGMLSASISLGALFISLLAVSK